MQEFLNPKSMITPGVAGGLVMLLANGLIFQFEIGKPMIPWTFLILSYLVGLFLLRDFKVKAMEKIVLYLLNSMIIFCMATGSNAVGNKVASSADDEIKGGILPIDTTGIVAIRATTPWVLASFVGMQDDTAARLREFKKSLRDQIHLASTNIQVMQSELVTNQSYYNNVENKLSVLKENNIRLAELTDLLKKENTFTSKDGRLYQDHLIEIQNNIKVFQGALILEKKNRTGQKQFFTDW